MKYPGRYEFDWEATAGRGPALSWEVTPRNSFLRDKGRCTTVHHIPLTTLIPAEKIHHAIYDIRDQKVMLDFDLAELYGIPTKILNQAVQRNRDRFPSDFMFRLEKKELENWRSQFVTSNSSLIMGLRRPPYAFTEHGILMLSSVLRSTRAIQVNIAIMRTFVELRKMILSYSDLCRRIDLLESRYDEQFRAVFDAIRELMTPEPPPENENKIGFRLV